MVSEEEGYLIPCPFPSTFVLNIILVHNIIRSGSLFSTTEDYVVARGEELFAGELPALHPLRVHQLGQFCGRAGHSAWPDGVASDDAAIARDDV